MPPCVKCGLYNGVDWVQGDLSDSWYLIIDSMYTAQTIEEIEYWVFCEMLSIVT